MLTLLLIVFAATAHTNEGITWPEECGYKPERNSCSKHSIKYFFNVTTEKCEQFYYDDCTYHGNKFATIRECLQKCENSVRDGMLRENRCSLPAYVGPCHGGFPRYFYNTRSRTCEQFIYGGCEGNANNFWSKEDCQRACVKSTPEENVECNLTPETGNCGPKETRYFYDIDTQKCKRFRYGGCRTNSNNFKTEHECLSKCGHNKPSGSNNKCHLELAFGHCHETEVRYYYDANSGSCFAFNYNGCGGNANNFHTYEECYQQCKV